MTRIGIAVAGGLMLFATSAVAQDDNIVFGIYYRCSQAQEAQADEVVRGTLGPIAQKHVDAGHLTGWLWLTHSQGGAWRRLFATTGTDMGQMMDVRQQIVEEFTSEHADAAAQLGAACPGHDDYIWTGVSNSAGAGTDTVGGASLSAYHSCDRSREGRADQIFTEVLAPLYQKHQDMGHIASWAFYAHRVGGIFRRLETFSGADHMTLLNMQNAIYQEANETNPLAMQEFNQICSWHADYMWENTSQN